MSRAHQALMRLYAWSGRHAAALRQYEECARLLDDELGSEPEAETVALYAAIKARRLEPPAARQPASVSPDDVPQLEAKATGTPPRASHASAFRTAACCAARPNHQLCRAPRAS